MNNSHSSTYYNTDICEDALSHRTYISLYKGLKDLLPAPVYIVSGNRVYTREFNDIETKDGCIILKGYVPRGLSLLEIYNKIDEKKEPLERVIMLLNDIRVILSASKLFYGNVGFYHPLILNSMYLDKNTESICFISQILIDLINSTKEDEYKKLIEYCVNPEQKEKITDPEDLSISICRLIYLFMIKNSYSISEPEVDIRCFYNFIPRYFAKTVWDGLSKKKIPIDKLEQQIDSTINILKNFREKKEKITTSIPPLFRRPFFSRTKHRIRTFISFRRGLLIIIVLLGGFGTYMIIDFIKGRKDVIDIRGLPPEKIVEIYVKAVDDLDVEVLDTLFYRRAGKKLINEISTMYVVSRLGQVYSKKPPESTKPEEGFQVQRWDPMSIQNVSIKKVDDSLHPIFRVSYIKRIEMESGVENYSEIDTLYLAKIKNKWRIVRIERSLKEINR